MTSTSFAGKVALVTGGAGAIGSAVVARLRGSGATVIAADSTANAGEVVSLDVRNRSAIIERVAGIEREHGGLDILVNVAGVVSFGSAESLAEDEWDRVEDLPDKRPQGRRRTE